MLFNGNKSIIFALKNEFFKHVQSWLFENENDDFEQIEKIVFWSFWV